MMSRRRRRRSSMTLRRRRSLTMRRRRLSMMRRRKLAMAILKRLQAALETLWTVSSKGSNMKSSSSIKKSVATAMAKLKKGATINWR